MQFEEEGHLGGQVELYGKLATSPAGLTDKFSKKVLVWSLGWCHWMLLIVLFPKLVSDWSKVHWMPSFRRRRVWGLLLMVPLDAAPSVIIVVSVRAVARTRSVLYLFDLHESSYDSACRDGDMTALKIK